MRNPYKQMDYPQLEQELRSRKLSRKDLQSPDEDLSLLLRALRRKNKKAKASLDVRSWVATVAERKAETQQSRAPTAAAAIDPMVDEVPDGA